MSTPATRRRRARLPDPEAQPTMTAAEVGAVLRISPRRACELAAAGELPALRLGGRRWRFLTAELRRQLAVDPPEPGGGGEAADALAP
jgi:excisionase family DNA binding protein